MAKIMVFQHVPYEPLGTLDALIRLRKHRIRYINFGRDPQAKPNIEGYDALIILGGPMNIGEEALYPHLDIEKKVILQAIDLNIPILGICLGAQLIAAACGGRVKLAAEKEVGWYKMTKTKAGRADPVIRHLLAEQKIFQWHSYTFELPATAELLVSGDLVTNQAFRLKQNVYGLQFHLEANLALIERWLKLPQHLEELGLNTAQQQVEAIWTETRYQIENSLNVSKKVFSAFLDLIPKVKAKHRFSHR
ncbi:glutamine amidotransferase-related protein [Aliikangiella sp. IMCC44653]